VFGRHQPKPDPALLAQARATGEVKLGAYAEELLAVTGAYPLSGSLDPRPGPESGASPFRHPDIPARQEFSRLAGFLFADVSIPEGQHLRADADMQFRFGPRTLKVDNSFVREAGAEEALGKIVVGTKQDEPRYIRVSASDLVNLMTSRFEATEARM
jgi:hypothetical protein